jgi:hypothetical protein
MNIWERIDRFFGFEKHQKLQFLENQEQFLMSLQSRHFVTIEDALSNLRKEIRQVRRESCDISA